MAATTRARKKQLAKTFDFWGLLRELRNWVYELLLVDSRSAFRRELASFANGKLGLSVSNLTPVNLLLVSRDFKKEVLEMPGSMPEVHIEDDLEDYHRPCRRFNLPVSVRWLTTVTFEISVHCYGADDPSSNAHHPPRPCAIVRDLDRHFDLVADILQQLPKITHVEAFVEVDRADEAEDCEHAVAVKLGLLSIFPDTMSRRLINVECRDLYADPAVYPLGPDQRFVLRWEADYHTAEEADP